MQNPFGNNDDNQGGPGGLPLPPNYATVVDPTTGEMRLGKVGFSFTALIFTFLVPVFRNDWYNFLCMIGLQAGVFMGVYSLPNLTPDNLARIWAIADTLFQILWGFIYNMMYFKHLFNRGFQPTDQRSREILVNGHYLKEN
ncbi:hypothetical protein GPK34_10930 [Secundilactobacillus kimchicus]|uniref:Uncharacterized protein n=3 Tax=Secundilactobacillus TaxID=2767892 RepID=A0A0R1HVD7_9LACO|nr:DUF2628 domain-containing protein [Secundilactobacillus kimchicus]KRK47796.1 hypothetical protein FC96_GL002284 [Secundilactobacillus kimchicus JCM 15530]MBT9672538.1 hypothetical protein [Secundilactobacillus kimchicus]